MTEQWAIVETHHVIYNCDEPGCGKQMVGDGSVLTCTPPKYPHRCDSGHYAQLSKSYPRIEFVDANGMVIA